MWFSKSSPPPSLIKKKTFLPKKLILIYPNPLLQLQGAGRDAVLCTQAHDCWEAHVSHYSGTHFYLALLL